MLTKVARKKFIERYPDFPQVNRYRSQFVFPEIYKSYILSVDAKSTIGLCNKLSAELTKLISVLEYKDISFLGDSTIPWLYREHDHKPVQRALDYLKDNKISKSFNGAIKPAPTGLIDFFRHLFWLVRCNGVLFYPHFSDSEFNFIATICQYGNIHFKTLNQEVDAHFLQVIGKTNLIISDTNKCSGKIFQRRTSR